MTDGVRLCPACASESPEHANFCPMCGHPLKAHAGELPHASSPPTLFGVVPPTAAFVLGSVLLAGAVAAFVSGSAVVGIVLLAGAAAVFVVFYRAAERDPSGYPARIALAARERARSWPALVWHAAGAWLRAARDLVRLRRELRTLNAERDGAQLALGEASFREDDAAAATLRARMHDLERAIAEREAEREVALAHARERVEDERLEARRTEVLPPEGEDEPPRGS